MNVKRNNYSTLGDPVGPYVHSVRHGNTLYLSVLTAFGSHAQADTIESQTSVIFEKIQEIASIEGSSLENLIKITAFVTDLSRMEALRDTLFDIYSQHLPASSLVQVTRLFSDDLKIEIEAIIAVENDDD